jgi:hypothetical protein
MSNIKQGMSNYEIFQFLLFAVLMLVTSPTSLITSQQNLLNGPQYHTFSLPSTFIIPCSVFDIHLTFSWLA